MYDPRWDIEQTRSDTGFDWHVKLAFALVILSLTFVVSGAALILTDTFGDVAAEIWGVSAFLVVVCSAYGFCRLLPSKRRGQVQKAFGSDHASGPGTMSASPFR